ncbi:VOC family protein [Aspergillus novofumigatus IBT 16806]|uniref:Putative 3-demethylubiquinone-9 3-methyltransferase n=1 Tax=Aspergillus novofumigatus (strain IBT 16806) TaxID=1392255 RepID=A0A2I1CIX8_ASPN1|nr:putative 3-demethylubiquinone-9 3-methyltransferase [Aspergillus novofumigatus IBT 16806]PKX97585.1 putative 3-demethylubiquinone-9 3-methyltransferase [Aspergillus novofumigatus IBT 16806]
MSVGKLTTCLWFDGQAEEAASFYTSIFKNSKVTGRQYFPEAGKEFHGREAGSLMTIEFELNDQKFDQAEVDYYWDKLGEGGEKSKRQCGWLVDKFGLSWQIVPDDFHKMLNSTETEKRDRAYVAMLHMEKLDIAGLRKAFDGE